jgi:hypothetical protein
VDGLPGSLGVLSVRRSGAIRGLVSESDGTTWVVHKRARKRARLRSTKVDRQTAGDAPSFACEALEPGDAAGNAHALSLGAGEPDAATAAALPLSYTARVALELDYEFSKKFPDQDRAIQYAMDLLAFTGTVGTAELGMNVRVPYVRLWTVTSDPYSGGSSERLSQLRSWWNSTNATHCGSVACTSIARATTLMLSGAGTGGGVAYVGAMCGSYASPTNSYSYAFVGSIGGNFDITSPRPMWDVIATSHELGHNFGSRHTHCYSPAVDGCYASETGCYAGTAGLPAGCSAGQGCGTIMSYCHLLGGSYANVSLTYGAGHAYGNNPQRVPSTMIGYLAGRHSAYPACLAADGSLAGPSALAATAASPSQINLVWSDNSADETGFKIERKTGTGAFAQIATVGPNVTAYTNGGLSASTTYVYRVRGYNASGNSPYSNEASATTGAPGSAAATALACGQTVGAALSASDAFSTVRTTSKADVYTFAGTAGRRIRVVMTATSELNPYLILKDPAGAVIAKRNGTGPNATLTATLPSAGTYRIEATSYPAATKPRGLGSYTIALSCP